MFHYDLFADNLELDFFSNTGLLPTIFTYKCVYRGGREVVISADVDPASFIRTERKSPDLLEVWQETTSWVRIFPRKI
jgi:hypothetical protein